MLAPTMRPPAPTAVVEGKEESTTAPVQSKLPVESRLGARLGPVQAANQYTPPKPTKNSIQPAALPAFVNDEKVSNSDGDDDGAVDDELEHEATGSDGEDERPTMMPMHAIKPAPPPEHGQVNVPATKRPTTPINNKKWVEIDKAAVTAEYDRLLARDDKLQTAQDREFASDSSKTISGTCQTMCPDTEAYQYVRVDVISSTHAVA